jgi:hypothetical protein
VEFGPEDELRNLEVWEEAFLQRRANEVVMMFQRVLQSNYPFLTDAHQPTQYEYCSKH